MFDVAYTYWCEKLRHEIDMYIWKHGILKDPKPIFDINTV